MLCRYPILHDFLKAIPMHKSSRRFGRLFFETYRLPPGARILDVGSLVVDTSDVADADLSGSLRDFAPPGATYVGADLGPGRGVDIVLTEPGVLPFDDGCFHAIVSTSCFEHDRAFWMTFQAMARVTAPGGYIYINAPSNGAFHRYPLDCWRFYPDAGLGLAAWATRAGFPVVLLESFIGAQDDDQWNDCVMVFARDLATPGPRMTDRLVVGVNNVHRPDRSPEPALVREETEDQLLLASARLQGSPGEGVRKLPIAQARGWVDRIQVHWASGWVMSPVPGQPAIVLAWLDGLVIGAAVADLARADLEPIGAGHTAFQMRLRIAVDPRDVGGRLRFEALVNSESLGTVCATPELTSLLGIVT